LFEDYAFSFINNLKVNFHLQLLSLIALFACYRQRRNPNVSLILIATLGILLSVPFAPPWDTAKMRAYAATIPVIALLPALGFEVIAKKMGWQQLVKVSTQEKDSQFLLLFSIIFAGFLFVAPITTKVFSRASQFAEISCQEGATALYLRVSSGSSINIVTDNSSNRTYLPDVRISDFRNGLGNLGEPKIIQELASLSPATTLMNSFDLRNKITVWLIAKSSLMPK
jgi:hypothetical protein